MARLHHTSTLCHSEIHCGKAGIDISNQDPGPLVLYLFFYSTALLWIAASATKPVSQVFATTKQKIFWLGNWYIWRTRSLANQLNKLKFPIRTWRRFCAIIGWIWISGTGQGGESPEKDAIFIRRSKGAVFIISFILYSAKFYYLILNIWLLRCYVW